MAQLGYSFAQAFVIAVLVAAFMITLGEPDLLDAMIHFLMKCGGR